MFGCSEQFKSYFDIPADSDQAVRGFFLLLIYGFKIYSGMFGWGLRIDRGDLIQGMRGYVLV